MLSPDLKFTLPKIYPITDRAISGLTHLEQVRRFAEGGATFIQLRDKTATSREFYQAAIEVMNFVRDTEIKVIVNDRVDIAMAVAAHGVHLGQDDLPAQYARHLLGTDAVIGYSTHSLAQARHALDLAIDYVAIGPVFATSTKDDPDPVVGLAGVSEVRRAIGVHPLVAIGGITRENAASVFEAGADSVAIIGGILSRPDEIADSVKALLNQP